MRLAEAGRLLEGRVKSQQVELEKLLTRYYASGQAQGLRHMLSGSDPNQLARDLYYLKQLSRSEADLIGGLRASLAEQKSLLDKARITRDALAEIESEQKNEVARLCRAADASARSYWPNFRTSCTASARRSAI